MEGHQHTANQENEHPEATGLSQELVEATRQDQDSPAMNVFRDGCVLTTTPKRGIKIKPFPCPHCEQAFTKVTALDTHIKRVHTGETVTFKCRFCDQEFPQSRLTKDHELKVGRMDFAIVSCTARPLISCAFCFAKFTDVDKSAQLNGTKHK